VQRFYIPLRKDLEENKRDFITLRLEFQRAVLMSGVIFFHLKGRQPVSRAQCARHMLGVENHKMQAR